MQVAGGVRSQIHNRLSETATAEWVFDEFGQGGLGDRLCVEDTTKLFVASLASRSKSTTLSWVTHV